MVLIKNDGTVICNGYGANANVAGERFGTSVVSVAVGKEHIVCLKADGTMVALGKNSLGQLGDGTTTDSSNSSSMEASNVIISEPARK